jgi:hypothetical protein
MAMNEAVHLVDSLNAVGSLSLAVLKAFAVINSVVLSTRLHLVGLQHNMLKA